MVSWWVPRALRTCSRDAQALGSLLSARPSPNASSASTRSAAPRSSACRAWNTWLDTLTYDSDVRSTPPPQNLELFCLSCPVQKSEYAINPLSVQESLHPYQGLYPLPHILASHCLPAAGQSCCGPVSKTQGLVPGPAAGSSTSTDKDVDCPVQLLVLPDQSQSAGDSRGPKSGPIGQYTTPTPKQAAALWVFL